MKLQFNYEPDDFDPPGKRFRVWARQVPLREWLWAVTVPLLVVLGMCLVIGSSAYLALIVAPGWLCFGVVPGVVLSVLFALGFIRGLRRSKQMDLAWALVRQWDVEVLPAGFWTRTDQFRQFTAWSAVRGVWNTGTKLWIASVDGSRAIPKRGIGSQEDFDNLSTEIVRYASTAEPEKQHWLP